jgi:hypothetical protein
VNCGAAFQAAAGFLAGVGSRAEARLQAESLPHKKKESRMNRRRAIGSVVAGAAAAVTVGIARAADPQIDLLVDHWNKSKDLTLKMADAMPAENFDYKPFSDARAFGAELQHLGEAEGFYLGRLGKGAAPAAPRGDVTKATTVNTSQRFTTGR